MDVFSHLTARASLIIALCTTATAGIAQETPPAGADTPDGRNDWVLEFGPYVGYYVFDDLAYFEDRGLFGARLGVKLSSWARAEGEFDEVYTSREVSGNRARQVSIALHFRGEPARWRLSPSVVAGIAFVALDDSDDADAFSEAWDMGLGLRYEVTPRWVLRLDGMLRRQRMRIYRLDEEGNPTPTSEEAETLWGRSVRLAVLYVF
jgi:hypothetical protein